MALSSWVSPSSSFLGRFNFNLTTVGYPSIRFISLFLSSFPLALHHSCHPFSQGARGVSVRRFHAEWWVGVSVCVRVLMWGCVLSLGIMSDRGERPMWVELLCLVPGHLSLAISVLPANRSQVVRSAYHEDQRLSVSPSLPLYFSRFGLPSVAPFVVPRVRVCASLCKREKVRDGPKCPFTSRVSLISSIKQRMFSLSSSGLASVPVSHQSVFLACCGFLLKMLLYQNWG